MASGDCLKLLLLPRRLTVAAIQANVPVSEKRDPGHEARILDLHVRLTQTALAVNPDLLIWPEAATPRPLFSDQRNWDVVRGLAEKHAGDFLLGTVHFDHSGDYNSAILLTDSARNAQLYHKIHLVPFGEYVPLRGSFPLFAWLVGELVPDDFDFGREPVVLKMSRKPLRIGPLICFEDTLGDLTRQFAQRGAQILVTVTNDAWFLKSVGSEQHVLQALFRCAETKLPMVRAANTGVTCVIDRFGRIVNQLQNDQGDTFIEGVLFAHLDVPTDSRENLLHTVWGTLFAWLPCHRRHRLRSPCRHAENHNRLVRQGRTRNCCSVKAIVTVMPKRSVLDPQGAATAEAMKHLGLDKVARVRVGKSIEIELRTLSMKLNFIRSRATSCQIRSSKTIGSK